MTTLTTQNLKKILDRRKHPAVVNVLPRDSYNAAHIPGTVNIPAEDPRFLRRIEEVAGGKDHEVVVYCAGPACDAAPEAARRLEEAGFRKVYDYEGGVQSWKAAGLPVEGEARSRDETIPPEAEPGDMPPEETEELT